VLVLAAVNAVSVNNTYPLSDPLTITHGPATAVKPVYPLVAVVGDVIDVYVHFPNTLVGTYDPTQITIKLFGAAAANSGTGALVAKPAGDTQNYYVQITVATQDMIAISPDSATTSLGVNVFEMDVRVNGVSKLRIADMVRDQFRSYYYLAKDVTSFVVGVTQTAGTDGATQLSNQPLIGKYTAGTIDTATPSYVSSSLSQSFPTAGGNLTAGYYYLLPSIVSAATTATISFTTDFYLCPFASTYIDYYGTFKGCSFGNVHQDYIMKAHACGIRQYFLNGICINVDSSCNTFDPLSGACLTCLDNARTAVRGSCVNATNVTNAPVCPTGTKLFNNVTCIPEECSAVYANGSCSACVNTAFALTNGACIAVNCGIGFYFSVALNQCTPLPDRCVVFNAITQLCKTCTNGFFPNTAGTCVSPCPAGQFFVNQQCYTLPTNCLNLTNVLHCDACATNYRLIQGECRLCNGPNPAYPCTTCPLNQFVNTNGQCVTPGANCASFDQNTGLCLSCANGLTAINGKCCPIGQSIQSNGVCGSSASSTSGGSTAVDFNVYYRYCHIFNSVGQFCESCLTGREFAPNTDRCQ
jgi:hypothetical protein